MKDPLRDKCLCNAKALVVLSIAISALAPACSRTGSALEQTPAPSDPAAVQTSPSRAEAPNVSPASPTAANRTPTPSDVSSVASDPTISTSPTPSPNQTPRPVPLDVNDISFLWPVPQTKADVDALISLNDDAADGQIFPGDLLSKLMDEAKTAGIGNTKIDLPDEATFKKPITWKVAGIRVNPSALGIDPPPQIGELPGIRLIVQPVTLKGDKVVIHDFAAHVVFDFFVPRSDGKRIPFIPDRPAFAAVVSDLRKIKAFLEEGGVKTTGQELNVHPGFTAKVPGFTDKIRALLKTHLSRKRLDVVSFMGIHGGFEPWIFFKVTVMPNGLTREAVSGNFEVSNELSQMLSFAGGKPAVDPAPVLAVTAVRQGFGISSSVLFRDDVSSHLDDDLFPNETLPAPPQLKIRDVADVIATPRRASTVTTDCVSCHTESTRRNSIAGLQSQKGVAFQQPQGVSGVSTAVLPKDRWNLRNFGWGLAFFEQRTFHPTVTQRAANEAAESVQMINRPPKLDATPVPQPIARRETTTQVHGLE